MSRSDDDEHQNPHKSTVTMGFPTAATATSSTADNNNDSTAKNNNTRGQIPIVCPGNTRPLAELQFLQVAEQGGNTTTSMRTLLVSACHDKLPMLRDGTTGDWIGSFAGHKGAVWSCQLDASGSLAATASGDFSAKLWDAITGQHLQTLPHLHIVKTCAFSPPTSNNNKACYSNLLATGGQEGCLRIYDLEATLLGGSDQPRWSLMHPQQPKACSITKLVWLNESTLLAGCVDGKIRVWQVPSNDVSLAESSSLQPVAILDTKTGKEIRDMELTTRLPSNNSQSILTVASADQVLFFDMSTTASFPLLKQFQMPINFLNEGGASLHPTSGSKFIAGGSDLWVRVFDYETGDMLECLKGHHGPIRCLRYSPDGSSYASGSEDGTIRLWKT